MLPFSITRTIGVSLLSGFATLAFVVAGAATASAEPNPRPRFLQPYGMHFANQLSGPVTLSVHQRERRIPPTDIARVVFEHSADNGESWTLISRYPENPIRTVQRSENADPDPSVWEAVWDVSALASGRYRLRVTMETVDGRVGVRHKGVRVNHLPSPVITCTGTGRVGEVEFHGEQSSDPDGRVRSFDWTFGDGALPGVCSAATGNTCGSRDDCSVGEVCDDRSCSVSGGFCSDDTACPSGETCSPGSCSGAPCFDDDECPVGRTCIGGVAPSTAKGHVVTHTFGDTGRSYPVSLVIGDNRRGFGTGRVVVSWLDATSPACGPPPAPTCRCTRISVRPSVFDRKRQTPLGPQHEFKQFWARKDRHFSGKFLGPLSADDEGQNNVVGFAFEVVAAVDGDPNACLEIQWAKASSSPGRAIKVWTGTAKDLDLDGTNDIDVSTQAKCMAEAGFWGVAIPNQCTIGFRVTDKRYGPDEPRQGIQGGAYEKPFTHKSHVGLNIIWFDAPSAPIANGIWNLDFVAVIRGTDNQYCFAQFKVRSDKNALPETLKVEAEKAQVNRAALPAHGW
jgi:hypothetical protein